MFLVLIFIRSRVDPSAMVRSEGYMSLKNPVTTPGIDPGAVRLVSQLTSVNIYHYTCYNIPEDINFHVTTPCLRRTSCGADPSSTPPPIYTGIFCMPTIGHVCSYFRFSLLHPSTNHTHTNHWFKITLPNTGQAHDKHQ